MTAAKTQPRAPLTRDRILETAVAVMDSEGLEAVTMRRLGRELGVEAMSLYNHVGDKQDLLNGITEYIMLQFELPQGRAGNWEDRVRVMARSFRNCLRAHPNVMQLLAEHRKPMSDPRTLQPIEIALATLKEAGLSNQDAAQAYKAFGAYIMGFVMQEVGGMFGGQAGGEGEFDPVAIAAMLPRDSLPNLAEMLPLVCTGDADNDFEYGLNLMLGGLRAKLSPG